MRSNIAESILPATPAKQAHKANNYVVTGIIARVLYLPAK